MRTRHLSLLLAFCAIVAYPSSQLLITSSARQLTSGAAVSSARTGSSSGPVINHISASKVGAPHVTQRSSFPVAVDGSKTPDRIPDYLAYRHFIMITAVPATASTRQVGRRDAFLARVNLSENDRAAYLNALAGVDEQLSQIAAERRHLSGTSADGSRFATLKLSEDRVFDDAQTRVRSTLSAEGGKRLDAHIQDIKRAIVIYGDAR